MTDRSLAVPFVLGLVLMAASPDPSPIPAADPAGLTLAHEPRPMSATRPAGSLAEDDLFLTADRCIACHKGVATADGTDVSIGYDWRASMMANSARDPYWQAAVRREVLDYPEAAEAIEDKCSRCHMPIANEAARAAGGMGAVFANLPGGPGDGELRDVASDGVSCAVCHQVQPDGLGEEASFIGGFTIDRTAPPEGRTVYGPFEPDTAGAGIMHSATGYRPAEGPHVQSSELCATCHTLFTHAVGTADDEEFPEQVPFLEWQASRYPAAGATCQVCHMPEVGTDVPVTGVLGRSRANVSRHVFRGGNFFMLRMLNRYRSELGVEALPQELQLAADRTVEHLKSATAAVDVLGTRLDGGELSFDVRVQNRSGHKFPTAYPSRRAWLRVKVSDASGRTLFESGAFSSDGSIVGNDQDADPRAYEPHYDEITRADQVQMYEAIMVDGSGAVTTGLMSAQRWVKDNRLLPQGFSAERDDRRVGVYGEARPDASFRAGEDQVRYRLDIGPSTGALTVEAELWFQPIGFRWAMNLASYDAMETARFVRYYESMAASSAVVVARGAASVR